MDVLEQLVIFSISLSVLTVLLLFLNWKILKVTEKLLIETITIRKDTKVVRGDSKRGADSFEVTLPPEQ